MTPYITLLKTCLIPTFQPPVSRLGRFFPFMMNQFGAGPTLLFGRSLSFLGCCGDPMVDARVAILYLSHYRQLTALPIFRKGIYSSCKSCAVCIRKATRLAASGPRDEGVLGNTWSWLLLSPPANAVHSRFDNRNRICAAPITILSQCKSLIPFSAPRKVFIPPAAGLPFCPRLHLLHSSPWFPEPTKQ